MDTLSPSNTVILETVFSHLSPRDIKTAALVSRTWRRVTETPRYWTKMRLNVHKENISKVLTSRIIKLVSGIKFESLGLNEKTVRILEHFLSAVVAGELSQLKIIMMAGCDLSSVDSELLSQSVVGLEECHLCHSELSTNMVRAILTNIVETEDLKIKRLSMFSHHLHATPADIIMKAAVKLEETNIYKCFSSPKEVND